MSLTHQLAMEYLAQGLTISPDVAHVLEDEGFDLGLYEGLVDVHGQEDIDPTSVDYFEYIDANH